MNDPLYVSRPLIPELSDLTALLQGVWASQQVTNEGSLHNQLEVALARHLEVSVAKLTCNGTAALQCALLSLDLPRGGEVITTPLTFAATAHAIMACGLTPVFADVDEVTLTLDPAAVARAITERTVAVIGVHVYGTLCDHVALRDICNAHGLKLVFDAAHAFGATLEETPVGAMGDLSIFSLHASKLYNTFEGGLVTSTDPVDSQRLRLARNFGIENEEVVRSVGINGKMSELNAAIGLLNLQKYEEERAVRSALRTAYDRIVERFPGLTKQIRQVGVKQSEQYYMIRVDPVTFGAGRDKIYTRLKDFQIFSRRYFWPICTDFECYRGQTIYSVHEQPVVEQVKNTVLCLPFHSGVLPHHVEAIDAVLQELSGNN
ncbi:DegT/DnrJ/EryC1/StrS family aminotransferase [Sediminimonas qiaohouensis]|uniref:DegT/DnrJ/EryC1/StrS family aminotransferase n=1 Tax=Sediminimonas qiaohouensis TaxID=552061 RepID=UPI00047AAC6A|nr:DegT/DnrJ/EryC1/StrS family aminotransferase [Sediminimonas qiaohouensis]